MKKKIVVLFAYFLFEFNYCVDSYSECAKAQTCAECFRKDGCVWCKHEKFNFNQSSCMSKTETRNRCHDFIENSNVTLQTIRNDSITSKSSGTGEIIQLQPQKLKLTNIKLGQKYNLSLSFKQAKNYPVDIYFLMDLSNSMRDDKEQLINLSAKIVETMKSLTNNVTLGFGSFVDKNIHPFVYQESEEAYSFKHHLSMVNNSEKFKDAVSSSKIVNTYDEPESGFDALVQAITCSEIGWRNPSRHIILLATDCHSHVAGDGKLGGAIIPNDGACHLNTENQYSLEQERDYPSVGQLSRLIQENNKNVIMAVTKDFAKTYENLFKQAKGVTVAGLDSDSANILALLEDQYKSITSAVEMVDNADNSYVRLRYFTKCLNDTEMERSECTGLSVDSQQVNFIVNIEVVGYPTKKEDRIQTIEIWPRGLNEKFKLEIELLRDCACELVDQTCPDFCDDFEPCVKCHQRNNSEDCLGTQNDSCKNYNIISENSPVTAIGISERECRIVDNVTDCVTVFVYGYDIDGVNRKVRYEAETTCPNPFPILSVSLSLMGAIIGIGLALLLIWRLLLFLYDRAEYSRFINESKNANWNSNENPLYVGASTSVSNPTFKMSFKK